MKLIKSEHGDINYLSQIVDIKDFEAHPNPEVTALKIAHVKSFSIIVGISETPGKYVYFPANSAINPALLRFANLYSHPEKNNDTSKKGFFEDNGRVKAIRLKGYVSEGFLLPLDVFKAFVMDAVSVELADEVCQDGLEFDTVEHNGKKFWVSVKYVVRESSGSDCNDSENTKRSRKRNKRIKRFDRIIPGQFYFHYDTILIKNDPYALKPTDLISITSKWHGTSHISAYVKCHKPASELSLRQRLAVWVTGNKELFDDYDYVYSSRTVIKNQYYTLNEKKYPPKGEGKNDEYFYADQILRPHLIKGMTVYAEIVGYKPSGAYVQSGYDYGCVPPAGSYEHGVNFKVMVYRITLTNPDGIRHEFSAREVRQWCEFRGLPHVDEFYYGYAKDLYPELDPSDSEWTKKFIERLADEKRFFMEMASPDCNGKVPHEGIVIKKEDSGSHAWKLKSFKFTDKKAKDLDNGIVDSEDIA